MFYYKKEKNQYYFWSDKHQGKFGPFDGIFCKNKYFGDIIEDSSLERKYPGYKYCYGMIEKQIFIVNKKGIEDIILT